MQLAVCIKLPPSMYNKAVYAAVYNYQCMNSPSSGSLSFPPLIGRLGGGIVCSHITQAVQAKNSGSCFVFKPSIGAIEFKRSADPKAEVVDRAYFRIIYLSNAIYSEDSALPASRTRGMKICAADPRKQACDSTGLGKVNNNQKIYYYDSTTNFK
ncbi:MAG: hypothetical protein K0S63_1438 [Gammaproteobacteria bacterium]|jgi:hypothetical protein|nr:hypothetical protein [Gammaproteobacteria bacterium]